MPRRHRGRPVGGGRALATGTPVDVPDPGALGPVADDGKCCRTLWPPCRCSKRRGTVGVLWRPPVSAAAFASRLGEMSLAAELATSCILAVDGFISTTVSWPRWRTGSASFATRSLITTEPSSSSRCRWPPPSAAATRG